MSRISLNQRRNSLTNNIRSRVVTEAPIIQSEKQNFNIEQNISQNLSSIKDTIHMLIEYQKLCIQKQSFLLAEQTKNKIQFLEKQQKTIEKQRGILKQQQNIELICKQGQEEIQKFQQYWDQAIQKLIQELKQIQANFVQQQQIQLNQYKGKIEQQEIPKIKYSAKVLELRKNLSNLIKGRKYKEAEQVKNKLKAHEAQCEQTWNLKQQQKIKNLIEKLQKKQMFDVKALRSKLEAIFNEKIKQRDLKFEILLKRNRKRRIESSKSKIHKLNQSMYTRSKSQSRVALGNSKMSSFNCSTKC